MCEYIPDPVERKNAVTSLIDGSLYSVMAGLTTPFWGAFAVKLGASDYLLGLLTSLPALAGLLAQIPSALLIDKFENRLKPTLVASIIHRTFFVAFAFLALVPAPEEIKSWAFVLAFALMNVPATMAGIAWTAMMGEMFTPELRGRIFGERNMICTLVSLVSTMVAGVFLDLVAWPVNYAVLYLVSYGFLLGSWVYLRKLEERPLDPSERKSAPSGLNAIRETLRDLRFVRFLLAVFVIHLGFHFPAALWTILWVKVMGLSNTWLGLFSVGSGVASFLAYKKWGYWSEKWGNPKVLVLTAGAHILFPVVYAHWRSPYVYLGLNVLAGFFGAGFALSLFNGLLDVSPGATRPYYVSLFNVVVGLSSFVWPVAGVWFYKSFGLTPALDLSFAIRVVATAAAAGLLGLMPLGRQARCNGKDFLSRPGASVVSR